MRFYISKSVLLFFLLFPASYSELQAQGELVEVSVEPGNTEWDWEPYTDRVARAFTSAIERRVREGIPRREFWTDTTSATLQFLFRIDGQGKLRRLVQLVPQYRYLAYLVRHAAEEIGSFDPLPENFPLFYFEGTINVTCHFLPAGRYKRFYFEEPLDTLEKTSFVPLIITKKTDVPLFLYEPENIDEKKLLEDYKRRIGMIEEITDTSIYSPLDFTDRPVAVRIAYDSLTGEPYQGELLKLRTELALERAGARLVSDEYDMPPPVSVPPSHKKSEAGVLSPGEEESDTSSADSVLNVELETSGEKPARPGEEKPAAEIGGDTDTLVVQAAEDREAGEEEARFETEERKKPEPQAPQDIVESPLDRNLAEAFAKVHGKQHLLMSLGVAWDTLPGRAVCRLRLCHADNPDGLKRRLDYRFRSSGTLPLYLGDTLIVRLTDPPPPPPPPEKAPPPAPDTSAAAQAPAIVVAPPDSVAARADSAAVLKPDSLAGSAVPDTSAGAKPDSLAGSAIEPTDTPGAETDSTGQATPAAAPPDSAAAPVDSADASKPDSLAGSAVPDTSAGTNGNGNNSP